MKTDIEGMVIVEAARAAVVNARGAYDDARKRAWAIKKAEAAYAEAKRQFPRAAAWMKADSYEMARHNEKSSAGRRAKARIENGEDAATVLADMKTEWSAAAARCVANSQGWGHMQTKEQLLAAADKRKLAADLRAEARMSDAIENVRKA